MWNNLNRVSLRHAVVTMSVAVLLAVITPPGAIERTGDAYTFQATASAVTADEFSGSLPASQISTRYTISIESVSGGPDSRPGYFFTNNVTVSGNVSATNYSGQLDQYHVRVDWGDGTGILDTWLQLTPGDVGKTFTGIWRSEPAHTYTQSGSYTITAVLYHQQFSGADRSEVAAEIVSVVVIIPPAIAGIVFDDFDADGVYDSTEGGIGNVSIFINGSDNLSTSTSSSGLYYFDNLSGGNYTVTEINPPDYVSTTPDIISVWAEANAVATADFGDSNTIAFITGTVYNDINANGALDSGEPGISGVEVLLDSVLTTGNITTDDAGQYSFTVTSPGDYNVSQNDLPGYYSTTPNTVPLAVSLGHAYTCDFGDRQNTPGTSLIFGIVYNDTDGDGVYDEGELGIGGTPVSLTGAADNETVTLSDGTYYFPDLVPGAYIVTETNLAAYHSTTSDKVYLVTEADISYRVNFGDAIPDSNTGFIFGTVFNDLNGNGLRELGELGMPGVAVSCNLTDNATTSVYGQYTFKLSVSGNFTVTETDPEGYYSTTPNVVVVPLVLGEQYPAVDFGDTALATCSLTLTPESVSNQLPGDTSELFTVTLLDQNGSGISGLSVSLTATFSTLDTTSVITGSGGTVTFTVSSDIKGTATITATLGPLSDNSTCTWLPPSSGGGGGGGPPPTTTPPPTPTQTPTGVPGPPSTTPAARFFTVDFLEKVTNQLISDEGRLIDDLNSPNPDETHWLRLIKDTLTLDTEGKVVSAIKIRIAKETPPLPAGTVVIGNAYDCTPSGITFDGRVRLTLGYTVSALPAQVSSIRMAVYTPDTGWTDCQTESGVAGIGSLTARVEHFSVFAILATTGSSETQANDNNPVFSAAHLKVAPNRSTYWPFFPLLVLDGMNVSVTTDVTNSGGVDGTWDLLLKVDGKDREIAQVALNTSETKTVTFTIHGSSQGEHTVQVAGLSGQYVTKWTINWWLLIVVALILAVAGWIVFLAVRRWRLARVRGRG